MAFPTITSLTNEAVKRVVRLHEARTRKQEGLFLVEGLRAVSTVLKAGLVPESLYCTEDMMRQLRELPQQESQAYLTSKTTLVTEEIMKKMSTSTTPSGLLALFRIPKAPTTPLTPGLVLAQISDPGNMGTLIRTAAACNVKSVVVVEGVDPYSPKVVQASAGSIALVTLFQWNWETLLTAKKSLNLAALVVEGGIPLEQVIPENTLLIVGNEARGLPEKWIKQCDQRITLPMPGGTESLNAAVAGSIATYLTFCKKGATAKS